MAFHPTPMPRRGVYAITDGPRADLLDAVRAALDGGAVAIQYRDKTTDGTRRLAEARALTVLCRARGVPLIVNDDVALAAAADADGVHLGRDDGAIAEARARLRPGAIVGVSCYDELARAREAAAGGADYLAFGAFFPTPRKPLAARATPTLLAQAAAFGLPRVAIGGIDADNAGPLIRAGADLVAAIGAVFGAADIAATTRALARHFD